MIFNTAYKSENRRNFLNFLRVKLFSDNLVENTRPLWIDRQTIFFDKENCFELGKVNLDKDITIFEIKQKSKNDPRITLTRDAFKIMEDKWINNALIVFYSDDSPSWRLSLLTLKKSWWEKEISDPKRYSFLLWEEEKTRTPEKYLNKQISSFDDLLKCFDVEVVRKEFFNHYLTLYIRLYKAILDDTEFVSLLKWQQVELVSFTKNLLGKVVFLYFIQKKGWLWVKRDWEYWKDGDKNFMRSIWNDFKNNEESLTLEKTNYFYNDYLEWLFFDGLNKDRRESEDYFPNLKMKVPYLNGWLFKEDYKKWDENTAKISNDIFSNENKDWIIDIFDTYNFTIDEDDLYDSDIAIDPEMLGRIFEKMISISPDNIWEILEIFESKKKIEIDKELNKKFGAFYTPREIVHYMTKESLISYLINNLKGKKEDNERKVRKLFELKEQFLTKREEITEDIFKELWDVIEEIENLLQKVKILDPAIGSGAFPMWILHEVSTIRYYIYWAFFHPFEIDYSKYKNTKWKVSMYKIKRDIIQKSIYWVDISAWAIDIAKLRFWLSLVVDEETPEPLPNFEFKFVCANTLIPLIENNQQSLEKEINVETLRNYMSKYYNSESNTDKAEWRKRIENLLWIWKMTLGFDNFKSEKSKQLDTYEPFNSNHSAEFFDPSLMMGNAKFDIVIGNPPYIKEYDNRNAFDWLRDKAYYMWKMDLWYYFACYWLDLLKENWVQSFIAQNNWITSFGAKKMRNKILEDAKIKEFIDFWDFKVFQNVWIQTMIYILEKTKNNINYEVKYSKIESKDFDRRNINKFLYDNKNSEEYSKFNTKIKKIENINKNINFINAKNDIIINKISQNWDLFLDSKEVANWIHPHHWLVSKKMLEILWKNYNVWDWVFYLSEDEKLNLNLTDFEKTLLKPLYFTDKIFRYSWNHENNYSIIYTNSSFKDIDKINDYPNIKNHLDTFVDIITSDNKPYWLHRARDEDFFIWEKIISLRKAVKPTFSYIDFNSYVWAEFYLIKTDKVNLKFLTWLLNSKLIEFWLKYKWKMQWNIYQVDKEPLVSIPIKKILEEKQKPFIELVDSVLEITKQSFYDPKNPPKEQLDLESEIDDMVYELYGLSEEEIKVVEKNLEK